jgi:hypothetical protein
MEDFCKCNLDPTPLLIDNQAAICMNKLPQFNAKQKHIPVRICHLKECCAERLVEPHPSTINTCRSRGDVETPILIIRETFPDVTSAYYFLSYFPYYVGSLLSLIYLNLFLFSFLFLI